MSLDYVQSLVKGYDVDDVLEELRKQGYISAFWIEGQVVTIEVKDRSRFDLAKIREDALSYVPTIKPRRRN